ncbi:MAG: phage major tail protein, TP901-1 family [Rhodospirillales bacterium]|nr:phage major tail protein, TP901-1 family [Rhodospirillales bacterium]
MTAQKGRDLLLKVDGEGTGTFTTVAGLRTRSLGFNTQSIDVTTQESAGQWRELLVGGGIRTARVSGSGIFKDAASDAIVRTHVMTGAVRPWQIVIPDFGVVTGLFQVVSFELTGRHDGEVAFELAIESAGEMSFTAI